VQSVPRNAFATEEVPKVPSDGCFAHPLTIVAFAIYRMAIVTAQPSQPRLGR
jgi:hypothetical protein